MSSKSKVSSVSSANSVGQCNVDECCRPEFIYGGPFIQVQKVEPFMNTATPINIQLQGTFKKSFAYYSLKERLPIILTKVIDYLSRQGSKIKSANGANDEDIRNYIKFITKIKNDLVTNKQYDLFTTLWVRRVTYREFPLTYPDEDSPEESKHCRYINRRYSSVDTPDAKKWNQWIEGLDSPRYFTNVWVFTECYVYRKLREGCELSKGLKNFDPFDEQKDQTFAGSIEAMCVVAEKLVTMLPESDKDKRKSDFMTLLKICLWANKCDLSLSNGEQLTIFGGTRDNTKSQTSLPAIDPFQMIIDYKDKLLVDDTAKIADQVIAKAEAIAKSIEGPAPSLPGSAKGSIKGSPPASPPPGPAPGGQEGGEPEPIPCPAKMVLPQTVIFDIVCDNSGYELFSDLCLAHFLISQKIVQKIRFHIKNMPWFVSDVTQRDFKFVIDSCIKANYNRTVQPEPKPEPAEGEAAPEPETPRVISSDSLRTVAEQWRAYVDDGTFLVMAEDYWTWPHCYKDMKKYDYNLYRKLQYAVAILFKGDLNYRKLLGEKNWNPVVGFEPALQGFIPAPIIAVRTVKADLICGLPKGKWEQLNKVDEKWMETGDYGVIQFCAKAEPLKVSDRPCADYGEDCLGGPCPVHTDI